MIDTKKWFGLDPDIITDSVHKRVAHYTVFYEGRLMEGDTENYNEHECETWEEAFALYDAHRDTVHIKDNINGITLERGNWN